MGFSSGCANSQNAGLRVDRARNDLGDVPGVGGQHLELVFNRTAARKHPDRSLVQPHLGQSESQRQGGKGARSHGVHSSEARRVDGFDPGGMDTHRRACRARDFAKEGTLVLIAFDTMNWGVWNAG